MTLPWIDLSAARRRFAQIDVETQKLEAERMLIQTILDTNTRTEKIRPPSPRRHATRGGASPVRASPTRASSVRSSPAPSAKVSLVDLIADALRFAPSAGLTVADIVRHIARSHPDRASAPSASLLVSAAAAQASRAKKPRIKVIQQGGKGGPVRYGAA